MTCLWHVLIVSDYRVCACAGIVTEWCKEVIYHE